MGLPIVADVERLILEQCPTYSVIGFPFASSFLLPNSRLLDADKNVLAFSHEGKSKCSRFAKRWAYMSAISTQYMIESVSGNSIFTAGFDLMNEAQWTR